MIEEDGIAWRLAWEGAGNFTDSGAIQLISALLRKQIYQCNVKSDNELVNRSYQVHSEPIMFQTSTCFKYLPRTGLHRFITNYIRVQSSIVNNPMNASQNSILTICC